MAEAPEDASKGTRRPGNLVADDLEVSPTASEHRSETRENRHFDAEAVSYLSETDQGLSELLSLWSSLNNKDRATLVTHARRCAT